MAPGSVMLVDQLLTLEGRVRTEYPGFHDGGRQQDQHPWECTTKQNETDPEITVDILYLI